MNFFIVEYCQILLRKEMPGCWKSVVVDIAATIVLQFINCFFQHPGFFLHLRQYFQQYVVEGREPFQFSSTHRLHPSFIQDDRKYLPAFFYFLVNVTMQLSSRDSIFAPVELVIVAE